MTSFSYAVCLGVFCAIFLTAGAKRPTNECEGEQKTGVDWIIQERGPDYGWKEHTHRANIALAMAVNSRREVDVEVRRMELQLELEITKFLARQDSSSSLNENDLALFVQALLARDKNPRDFHGLDLVAELLSAVDARISRGVVNPFLVLALCDAGAVKPHHLQAIHGYTRHQEAESRYLIEMKALTLKAYACAVDTYDAEGLEDLQSGIKSAVKSLISRQNTTDGSFGNAYTTALVVQALFASNTRLYWEKEKALLYLKQESAIQVNMIKTYLIVVAQKAESVKFVKDLYTRKRGVTERIVTADGHFVTVVIQPPKTFSFGMRMEFPKTWNAYQILELFSQLYTQFNFTSYPNVEKRQIINSISGIPNDAEENRFWVLCQLNYHSAHDHTAKHDGSPETLVPGDDDTIYFSYGESFCPRPNGPRSFI